MVQLCVAGLAILACLASTPSRAERTDVWSEYNNITRGRSGPRCSTQGRKCVLGATCSNGQCVCPAGQRGQAEIECVKRGDYLCTVAGDPHLRSFGRANVKVPLPCRYRAARFVTKNVGAINDLGTCAFEVFATNELFYGNYMVGSVHISVGITDPALLHHTQVDVFKRRIYSVNDTDIYNYQMQHKVRDSIWGSSNGVLDGLEVDPSYDDDNNFAVLEVPMCEARIKYRAFDPRRPRYQSQLAGFSIWAPSHSQFYQQAFGYFPDSLCGTPQDGRLLFRKAAENMGLNDDQTAVIHAILIDRPAQTNNTYADQCEALFDTYDGLDDQRTSLNACSFVVTKNNVANCLAENGLRPIDVLNSCLVATENNAAGCQVMANAEAACSAEPDWVASDNYRCAK